MGLDGIILYGVFYEEWKITCCRVVDRSRPILYVSHDEVDGM